MSVVVVPDGWRFQATDAETDHFARALTAVRLTDPDGHSLKWSLPNRLLARVEVCQIVLEEMRAELVERHVSE